MTLTEKDRLFLLNQYLILEKLYPEDEKLWKENQAIVVEGYEGEYDGLIENFGFLQKSISNEVIDILQMYRCLQSSFLKLGDKTGINPDDVKFPGFDGNEETKQYMFADYFINTKGRFDEFKGMDINTHHNILEKYRRMLAVWRNFERYGWLTKEQILDILNAA